MAPNHFIDTRGYCDQPILFSEAVLKGIADGGGLFVPEQLPHLELSEILALADLPYYKQAAAIYRAFGADFDDEELEELMAGAYGDNFDDEAICPITSLGDGTHVLELWHGPTSAFKDMALQCLPRFFSASAAKMRAAGKISNTFLILVATSGDTGKAALEGFRDQDGVKIAVMYPDGGVSDIQYKQMATQRGDNTMVWAVRGNFDDCQTGAKQVFGDTEFNGKLMDEDAVALSSANSINWGRLLPQVVYYVSSYARLVKEGQLQEGELLDVCVPTGNFGNILAAWYAKQLGTPIGTLFCASNENRVLTDFINSGTYDIAEREFVLTPSPSMDILVSSNVERQLFELTGRDGKAVRQWMNDLNTKRCFSVDDETRAKLQADFKGGSVDNPTCLATIKEIFETYSYLIDPHTAVAMKVAQQLKGERQVLVASTAHWAKFGIDVYRALHGIPAGEAIPEEVSGLTGCKLNELIAEETGVDNIPAGLAELDDLPIRFKDVIDGNKDAIEASVQQFVRS